jgi:hypothetical protein
VDAAGNGLGEISTAPNNRAQGLRQEGIKLTSPYGTACSAPIESLCSGFQVAPEKHSVKL